jgi:HD-GYP domain-containing protein (c-di-GMP phosphodiesterase class II)
MVDNWGNQIYFHNIINALSYALDLTEGQPPGHSLRCCWIGMHFADYLNLTMQERHDLYYTLILKDAGCSSNAARLCELYGCDDRQVKSMYKKVDSQNKLILAKFVFKHCGLNESNLKKFKLFMNFALKGKPISEELISARCNRGANVARQLGLSEDVALGIYNLDEHYNGKGLSTGLSERDIPLYSRIALLSQVIDVFFKVSGKKGCIDEVNKRSGSWFDPLLIGFFKEISDDDAFWKPLLTDEIELSLSKFQPENEPLPLTFELLDHVAEVFGTIVDAKSPFTSGHSKRVGSYAMRIASLTDLSLERQRVLYPAALLHDVGKLGISNTILDKRGPLDNDEWTIMKLHPQYTEQILSRFLPFHTLSSMAADHHERLDGTGYFKGKKGDEICPETRIITIADIFDALTADRPYRKAMTTKEALKVMDTMRSDAIDNNYMDALHELLKTEDLVARAASLPDPQSADGDHGV